MIDRPLGPPRVGGPAAAVGMHLMNRFTPSHLWSRRTGPERHLPGSLPRPRRRRRLVVAAATALLIALLGAGSANATGTADEVHYAFMSATSVTFDWRATATDLRYGPANKHG